MAATFSALVLLVACAPGPAAALGVRAPAALGVHAPAALSTLASAPPPPLSTRVSAPVRFFRITSATASLNLGEVELLSFAGENVALGRAAKQSSTDRDVDLLCGGAPIDDAAAAVDGDTCTFQSTAGGFLDWWEVDLNSSRTDLATLIVRPRFDEKYANAFSFRANGASIELLDGARGTQATFALPDNFGAHAPTPFVADLRIALAPAVRFVRVTAAGPEALNFGGLSLLTGHGPRPRDAALGKPATQSSLYRETQAFCRSAVVDVPSAGVDGNACTFVATSGGSGDWWEVDLVDAVAPQALEFYVRNDDIFGRAAAYRANSANISFYDRAHGLMSWLQLPADISRLPVPWVTNLTALLFA